MLNESLFLLNSHWTIEPWTVYILQKCKLYVDEGSIR